MSTTGKTIRYTSQHLRQEFEELFHKFSRGCQAETISQFLGNDLMRNILSQTNQIEQKLNQECSIVFIGDFKRGKSTLINALLQIPVVTTDVTPETITINEIQYGSSFKINICLQDGGYIDLEAEELKADKLLPIITQYRDRISHLQIETPVEWLQGVRLVDTPGTGDIFKKFDSQVQTYLKKADMVVWVMSALTPLSQSEQAFLKLAVLPQDFPKIFFVINSMDITRNDIEAERLLNSSHNKIYKNFPNSHIFAVSALDEFCRIQSLPRPNLSLASTLENYFHNFKNTLQQSIILNRDVVQLERACTQLSQVLNKLDYSINFISQLTETDKLSNGSDNSFKLREKVEKSKQEIKVEISQLRNQALHWMIEFMERMQRETIAQLHQFSLNDIRCNFPFFLTDKLRQGIHECINVHQPIIIEKLKESEKSILEDLHKLTDMKITGANLVIPSAALDDMQWHDINALQLLIINGPIGDIMRVLTALFRQKETQSEKKKLVMIYQQRLQEYLPTLQIHISQNLDEIYTRIATNIEEKIEIIYEQEVETSLRAIKNAVNVNCSHQKNLDTKDEALSFVENTRSELKSFKEKLELVML